MKVPLVSVVMATYNGCAPIVVEFEMSVPPTRVDGIG